MHHRKYLDLNVLENYSQAVINMPESCHNPLFENVGRLLCALVALPDHMFQLFRIPNYFKALIHILKAKTLNFAFQSCTRIFTLL